jgi:hypothetical protein
MNEYMEQEGITEGRMMSLIHAAPPNPTPSVSVADLHHALTDEGVSYDEYQRLINIYAEQEHVSRSEAIERTYHYQAQDLHEQPTPQEPPISTEWFIFDEMAGMDAQSQSDEAPGLPSEAQLASEAGVDIAAPAVLDGSQPVEPTPPGERWGVIGRSPMDRLRGAVQRSEWQANYLNEWAGEPSVGADRGLSEQEIQRIREAVHLYETPTPRGTWITIPDFTGGVDEPGVRSQNPEQNTTTETEWNNMKRTPSYWIKSRYNPQFEKPYYVACGQLSQTRAKAKAKSLYGFNTMLEYKSENDYNKAIQKLKDEGYIVY